ncbi:MAG: hypothetical protein MUC87_00325 [Bacteroidia bacterium]|jgi:Ca2+/Na+ antiporter|nr:hypothetical protein [Bacteroidia bacterium]
MKTAQIKIENTMQTVLLSLSAFFMLTIVLSPLALFTMLGLLAVQLVSSVNRASSGHEGGRMVVYILYWVFAGAGTIATIYLLAAGQWGWTYRCMLILLAVMLVYFVFSLTQVSTAKNEYYRNGYNHYGSTNSDYQAQLWLAYQNEMARRAWENAEAWNNYYRQYYHAQQIQNY